MLINGNKKFRTSWIINADHQCWLMLINCLACWIIAYWLSGHPALINADRQCQSMLIINMPINADHQCRSMLTINMPINVDHQCQSMLIINANQCWLSMQINVDHQCRSMPINVDPQCWSMLIINVDHQCRSMLISDVIILYKVKMIRNNNWKVPKSIRLIQIDLSFWIISNRMTLY